MFIYELPIGSEVIIRCSLGLTYAEYKSQLVKIDSEEKYVLIDPIKIEDKVVGFNAPNIINVVTVVNPEDKKVYVFRENTIDVVRDGAERKMIYHRIASEESVDATNRRNNFRVFLGLDGVIQVGTNKRTHDVVVKDISANGFGILTAMEVKLREGQEIHLVFTDPEDDTRFSLRGTVVHAIAVDANTMHYGCSLPKEYDSIRRYAAEKQRKKKTGNK